MADRFECFLRCVPPKTSHHAKRIVRVGQWTRLADKPELVAARAMLDELLLPHQPDTPLVGPVALHLEFTWPWLASDSHRTRLAGRILHTSKPDCDNAAKAITDRLAALRFLEQDQQVAHLSVFKWRGDQPGILIRAWRLSPQGLACPHEAAVRPPSGRSLAS